MSHHVHHSQSRRSLFTHLSILCRREDQSKVFSSSVVYIILSSQNDASKSPCHHRIFSYPHGYHYQGSIQERNIRRPASLLWHDRVSRMRDTAYSYYGMT